MKLILLLVLAVLMPPTYAGRARPRLPLIRELVRKTPWQNIAAGGAAAGTVIVASKVGNGTAWRAACRRWPVRIPTHSQVASRRCGFRFRWRSAL